MTENPGLQGHTSDGPATPVAPQQESDALTAQPEQGTEHPDAVEPAGEDQGAPEADLSGQDVPGDSDPAA